MEQIQDYDGKLHNLSDKEYEVLTNGHPSCKKGTIVRLISGVDNNETAGYHFDASYRTVCETNATVAQFLGIKKSALRVKKGELK